MKLEKLVPVLDEKTILYLYDNKIINWIWIEGENLENVVLDIIRKTYKFDEWQSFRLLWDIKQIAYYHDIMYTFKLWFYYSNIRFAYKVFYLIDWDIWYRRLWVFIWIILLLNKYWKVSYNN